MIERAVGLVARIDRVNLAVGRAIRWLVPIICIVTVVHGISRRLFSLALNHISESQWYMFAAIFMIGAGHTYLRDEHVRIDVLRNRFSDRTRDWVEMAGCFICLVPICTYLVYYTAGMFWISLLQNEGPPDVVVGLPRWVLIAFMPLGFVLLGAQCVSEGLKAALRRAGHTPPRAIAPGLDLAPRGNP